MTTTPVGAASEKEMLACLHDNILHNRPIEPEAEKYAKVIRDMAPTTVALEDGTVRFMTHAEAIRHLRRVRR